MTDKEKRRLADMIAGRIADNFATVYLSGNLANTIRVEEGKDGLRVIVPAVRYDLQEYMKNKVIVYLEGQGSYAEAVNKRGGFSKKHKGYVEKAIEEGITQWLTSLGIKPISVETK